MFVFLIYNVHILWTIIFMQCPGYQVYEEIVVKRFVVKYLSLVKHPVHLLSNTFHFIFIHIILGFVELN